MFALTADAVDPVDPLAGLGLHDDHPEPVAPPGWEVVDVRAASLNHHDLWTLRGVGVDPDRLPIVLGCDAAGVTADGRAVIVHAVVTEPGTTEHGAVGAGASILSERYDGTFAHRVAVPTGNLVDKPASVTFEEAACLPTAWLTAYRMLFVAGQLRPGQRVLVQGASGGVATAAVLLAHAAGVHVIVAGRDPTKLEGALALGADEVVRTGERLRRRVDAVIETVGASTFDTSVKALAPGGVLVVGGATSGHLPTVDLRHVFYRQLRIVGSSMGTRSELEALLSMLEVTGVRPPIADVMPLRDGRAAFARLLEGRAFGKLVLRP